MGRKKKKKQVEIKPKEETILNYTGSVSIALLRKGKIVKKIQNHNDGNNNLFKFILNCLAGEYYDIDRPKWIIPFYTDTNEIDKYSVPSFIPINSIRILEQPSSEGITYVLSYKCLITSSYLGVDGTNINGLLFYSDNGKGLSGDMVKRDDPINNHFQMKMSFGDDPDQTEFKDQDILIEWQVRIVSAVQKVE